MAEETGLAEDWNSLWRSMTKTLIAEGESCGPLLCLPVFLFTCNTGMCACVHACVCEVWTMELPVLPAANPKWKQLSLITTSVLLMGLSCCSCLRKMQWWLISFRKIPLREYCRVNLLSHLTNKGIFTLYLLYKACFISSFISHSVTPAVWRNYSVK